MGVNVPKEKINTEPFWCVILIFSFLEFLEYDEFSFNSLK